MNRFLLEIHGMIRNSQISNRLVFPMNFNMKFNRTVNPLTLISVVNSISNTMAEFNNFQYFEQ